MTVNYNGNDLTWVVGGDLNISSSGDIDTTVTYSNLLSLIQEIRTRVCGDYGDWSLHKEIGASLSDLLGYPNTKETAEIGKAMITTALTRGGFLSLKSFKVRYMPYNREEILFNILVSHPDLNPDQYLSLSLTLNLSNTDVGFRADEAVSSS